jgi:hypothetical protein
MGHTVRPMNSTFAPWGTTLASWGTLLAPGKSGPLSFEEGRQASLLPTICQGTVTSSE